MAVTVPPRVLVTVPHAPSPRQNVFVLALTPLLKFVLRTFPVRFVESKVPHVRLPNHTVALEAFVPPLKFVLAKFPVILVEGMMASDDGEIVRIVNKILSEVLEPENTCRPLRPDPVLVT